MIKVSTPNMRLVKEKNYWQNQLIDFTHHFDKKEYLHIEFGKQDIRGGFSITFFDHRHCVPKQIQFGSKDIMLGYVEGFNAGKLKEEN